jgi:hypothetical protein
MFRYRSRIGSGHYPTSAEKTRLRTLTDRTTVDNALNDSRMIRIAGLVGGGLPAMAVLFHAAQALSRKSVGVSPSRASSVEMNSSSRPAQSRTRHYFFLLVVLHIRSLLRTSTSCVAPCA